MEEWKLIKNYEGLYEVSNLGRIRSLDKLVKGRKGTEYIKKGKILKQIKHVNGYMKIGLTKDGKRKTFLVHRLVAEAFISNPENKPYIDHINTIKDDNRVENLRWATASENQYNELTTIKKKEYKGEKCYWYGKSGEDNPRSKKVVQFNLDGSIVKIWDSASQTEEFGFLLSKVTACCRKERKTHKKYKWMYYEDYLRLI